MARSVLNTPMGQMMYSDALLRMAGGAQLLPHEQDILTLAPLPESFISPFASQESGLLETLRTTAKALDVWDEEIKKVDYFTKHFTDLSKMVMKGVTTMGRGLMSLHNMGEDLSLSPKSIQDLIMIASYHFRKSYIGVLQTVKKYLEVSTRLLVNQLDWANMIFRLNVTKLKLEKPVAKVVSCQLKVDSGKEAASSQLQATSDVISGQLPMAEEVISYQQPAASELSALRPISEPSAIGGSRAFSPLVSGSKLAVAGKAASSQQPAASVESAEHSEKIETAASCQQPAASESSADQADLMSNEEKKSSVRNEAKIQNQKSTKENKTNSPENTTKGKEKEKINDQEKPEPGSEKETKLTGTGSGTENQISDKNQGNKSEELNNEKPKDTETGSRKLLPGEQNETNGVRPSCLSIETRGSDPAVSPPDALDPLEQVFTYKKEYPPEPEPEPPSYAGTVMAAVERSKGNPEGIRFTMDEVRQLLSNPDFCRDEPDMAAQFRTFLRAGP